VRDKYLFELERNLELQASGFLMQKESSLLQSQIRTEHFQISLLDRLRNQVNQEISIDIKGLNTFTGTLKEIASDHICLEVGEKEYAFPVEVIQFIKNVSHKSQLATLLQSKWNFQSYLRSALIEKKQISIYLIQAKIVSGTVSAVYQDHFDLKLDNSILSIFNGSVIYMSKERDFDD
jgi:hypothetical protein